IVIPAPSTLATTVGTTRASVNRPAPRAPSAFATTRAPIAVAPLESRLVAKVMETFLATGRVIPRKLEAPAGRAKGMPVQRTRGRGVEIGQSGRQAASSGA